MSRMIILVFVLFFSGGAFAQAQNAVAETGQYDCAGGKQHMIDDLMKPVECTHDDECGWFDYGYPWQPAACTKAIVNTTKANHNMTNMRLIEEYNEHCIYPIAAEKKKYDEFKHTLEIKECTFARTYCYKGFCRINNYAIYNDK